MVKSISKGRLDRIPIIKQRNSLNKFNETLEFLTNNSWCNFKCKLFLCFAIPHYKILSSKFRSRSRSFLKFWAPLTLRQNERTLRALPNWVAHNKALLIILQSSTARQKGFKIQMFFSVKMCAWQRLPKNERLKASWYGEFHKQD